MNKNDFLLYLEEGLIEQGIDPSLAARHVSHFGKTITQEDEDEISALESPDDLAEMIEGMAVFLKQRIQQKKKAAAAQSPPERRDFEDSSDVPTMEIPPVNTLSEDETGKRPQKISLQDDEEDDGLNLNAVIPEITRRSDTASIPKYHQAQNQNTSSMTAVSQAQTTQTISNVPKIQREQGERLPEQRNRPVQVKKEEMSPPPKIEFDYDSIEYNTSAEPTTKGKAIFWATFALTLPLTAAIFLGISAVFFGLMGGFSLVIAGVIAGLVAMVAAGSAVSLVGVIYGITQLFVSFPIGLYEIGLGVIITGFMMLAGILLYNFAIRLLPFVIKKIYQFFRFYLRSVRYLFSYLKGECYTL